MFWEGNYIKYLENHLNEAKRGANESQSIEAGKDCVWYYKSFSREEVREKNNTGKEAMKTSSYLIQDDPPFPIYLFVVLYLFIYFYFRKFFFVSFLRLLFLLLLLLHQYVYRGAGIWGAIGKGKS